MLSRSRGSGVNTGQVRNAADDLKDQLGEIVKHRYSGNVAESLSPEQQHMINEYLAPNIYTIKTLR